METSIIKYQNSYLKLAKQKNLKYLLWGESYFFKLNNGKEYFGQIKPSSNDLRLFIGNKQIEKNNINEFWRVTDRLNFFET